MKSKTEQPDWIQRCMIWFARRQARKYYLKYLALQAYECCNDAMLQDMSSRACRLAADFDFWQEVLEDCDPDLPEWTRGTRLTVEKDQHKTA